MPTFRSGGIELWYDVQGEGEPLVLSGGFGLLHEQFHRVTPLLAREFKVVNWNWRGAGNSDRAQTAPYSVEAWTDDLRAVLDELGLERPALWGTSTGSLVSIHFAARHPERVRALVTYPVHKTDIGLRKAFEVFVDVFEAFGWEAFARIVSWIGLAETRLNTPEGIEFTQWEAGALARNLNPEAVRRVCEAVADCDLSWDLPRLRCPVLLLGGVSGPLGLDAPGIRAQLDAFRVAVPGAEVASIPDAGGTYCVLEEPERTAAAAVEWLLKVGVFK